MTSREFDSKYKVLKQITGGAGRSYTAQDRATGRAVLVHVFEPVIGAELAARVDRLQPLDRAKVLDIVSVDGMMVIITQVLEGFQSLDGWLRARVAGGAEPVPERGPASAHSSGGGDFTELFRPPGRSASPAEATEPPPPPAPPPRQPEPAGFTELFAAPSRTPAPTPSTSPPLPRTPISSVPPVRMVDLRMPQARLLEGREAPPPPLRPNLSGGGSAPPPVPSPSSGRAPGDPLIAAPPPRPMTPPPAPAWSGPSDFTRELERGPHLGSEAPPVLEPPPPPEPPPTRSASMLPLLVATNLISMLVTALIVYFAFGRR